MISIEKIITKSRKSIADMMSWHQEWVNSNGRIGMRCLNYDELVQLSKKTDAEIIQYLLDEGNEIEGAEEFIKTHS